ncbi:MAG: sigma 54-interacting transcriptional regulator [Anaeromyxobacter sp.]
MDATLTAVTIALAVVLAPSAAARAPAEEQGVCILYSEVEAPVDPVLVLGETGTGKTAVASAVHALGGRRDRSFRTVNCTELGAGDVALANAKLFGLGRGSGLGGVPKDGQPGLLDEADGGVLFLDEVGSLPVEAQRLLLLPLERRPFNPAAGRGEPRTVDVKFIAATNRDLAEDVQAGRFPRDVFERLAGSVIHLPPLRARPEDVGRLAVHFLGELGRELGEAPLGVGPAAAEALARYGWPGNARELRRTVRHAAQRARLAGRASVEREDLPPELWPRATPAAGVAAPAGAARAGADPLAEAGFTEVERREIRALVATGFRVGEAEALLGYSQKSRTLSHRLRGIELKALDVAGCDPRAAARLLVPADPVFWAVVERRLARALEAAARNLEVPDRTLMLLRTEHRRHALRVMAFLRKRPA